MVRIFQVKDYTKRKQRLVAESDILRRTLRLQVATVQQSIITLKKRFAWLGLSSVAASVGASLAGVFLSKRRAEGKPGIISKVLSGISFFNQVKGIFSRVKSAGDEPPPHAD